MILNIQKSCVLVCELLPKNASTWAVTSETKDHTLSATWGTFPVSASCLSASASTYFSLIFQPALSMNLLSPLSLISSYGEQRQELQCRVGLLLNTIHTCKLQQPDELSIIYHITSEKLLDTDWMPAEACYLGYFFTDIYGIGAWK